MRAAFFLYNEACNIGAGLSSEKGLVNKPVRNRVNDSDRPPTGKLTDQPFALVLGQIKMGPSPTVLKPKGFDPK